MSKNKSIQYKEEGNKYFQVEQYDQAISCYTKAIEQDNTNPIFFSNRSACFLALSMYNEALEDALNCLEIDKSYMKGYYRAANSYLEMKKFDEALEIINKVENLEKQEELINLKKQIILKKEETEFCIKNYKSFNSFQRFFNWLDSGKVLYNKLELKYFSDDHRGILAKNKIRKDEIILQVPLSMLITLEMAKESPFGMKMVSANLNLNSPKHCFLTTYILQERVNPNTKWQSYIDILPKSYDNFPIFFTEEEKTLLQGSPFLNQVNEKIADIKEDYNMILKVIPEYEKFSFKEFCEIRMAVSSRIFGIKVNKKKTDCFSPLADMLNHKRPRQTQWYYSDEHGAFLIQSLQDIEKGEQVYDSYGKKCNSRFLLNYGFIVEKNDGNEFPFTVGIEETDALFATKKNLLQNENLKKTFRVQENFNEQPVIDFFSLLRFKMFNEDMNELFNIIVTNKNRNEDEDSKPTFHTIPPISIKNELKVLEYLEKISHECLNKYPTTLEEDEKILKEDSGKLTNNQRNCILMRMGEKEILHFFLNFSVNCSKLFQLDAKELKKKVKKDFSTTYSYEDYVNDVILFLIRKESSSSKK